jgi:hypothetical protein
MLEMSEKDNKLLQDLNADYAEAKSNKDKHEEYLLEMQKIYNCEYPIFADRSNVNVPIAKNTVNFITRKVVNDFTTNRSIIDCYPSFNPVEMRKRIRTLMETVAQDTEQQITEEQAIQYIMKEAYEKADNMKDALQHYWSNCIDNRALIRDFVRKSAKFGISYIKTGWNYNVEYSEVETHLNVPISEIERLYQRMEEKGKTLIDGGETNEELQIADKLVFAKVYVIKDNPDAYVVNELDIMRDPASTTLEDARFVIERFFQTMSDIRKQSKDYNRKTGIYEDVDRMLVNYIKSSSTYQNYMRDHGTMYENTLLNTIDDLFNIPDIEKKFARQKIELYRYYGYYDYDNDGVAEFREIVFHPTAILYNKRRQKKVKFPYVLVPYDREAEEKEGNSAIETMGDSQKIITIGMRAMTDIMAKLPLNSEVWDALSLMPHEREKIEANYLSSHIFTNKDPSTVMMPRVQPQIPTLLPQMVNMAKMDAQSNSGYNDTVQGTPNTYISDGSATEATIAAQGVETHYYFFYSNVSEAVCEILRHWICYIEEMVDDEEMLTVTSEANGKPSMKTMKGSDYKGEYTLKPRNLARSIGDIKERKLIEFMQYSAPMVQTGALPQSTQAMMVAKLADYMEMPDVEFAIKQYVENTQSQEAQQYVQQTAEKMAVQKLQEVMNSPQFQDKIYDDAKKMADYMFTQKMMEERAKQAEKAKKGVSE